MPPDALLANALVGLNDKPSACQALTKLHAEFPTLRLNCTTRSRSPMAEPVAGKSWSVVRRAAIGAARCGPLLTADH